MTDQQIDELLEMLAKSPTSARDMVRGLFAANEAKAAPAEPFGYFRAEPFGWTDCAADDEGAIALYERPAAPAVPMSESQRADMICAVAAICTGTSSRTVAATAIEWVERYYGITTPAAPSQEPVTLTDEEIEELQWRVPAARNSTADDIQIRTTRQMTLFARAIIAALRDKEQAK